MTSEEKMFKTGLLILTKPLPIIKQGIPRVLKQVAEKVQRTLYIQLIPRQTQQGELSLISERTINPSLTVASNPSIRNVIVELYKTSASVCQHLDVRVLLSHITGSVAGTIDLTSASAYPFRSKCEVILMDEPFDSTKESVIIGELSKVIPFEKGAGIIVIPSDPDNGRCSSDPAAPSNACNDVDTCLEVYEHAVMGGTFDRLHSGHKILLSDACLRCSKSVTVGITDEQMNSKKTLCELILPVDQRIRDVMRFMEEVKPRLQYKVVPIPDPFGPSTVDPQLQCIVVSQETLRGGHKVNEERARKGLSHLDVHVIELVEDTHHSPDEEVKISSSSSRRRLLGTLLKENEIKPGIPRRPYRIGLAGGIASGKSSVCKRLEKLGAGIIDCDKLGHQVYKKGTDCYDRIVSEFGADILQGDGEIKRRSLGAIVFSDKNQLTKLNKIVWPEISKLAEKQIENYSAAGKSIVVLDAAVLLEAGWDQMVHEVWSTVIPQDEAVKRLQDRNKLDETEALKRITSQMTSVERVQRSNVVLSTFWEYEVTQKQVEKAWALLNERITNCDKSQL